MKDVVALVGSEVDPIDVNTASPTDGSTALIVASEGGHSGRFFSGGYWGCCRCCDMYWDGLRSIFAAVNGHVACTRCLVAAGAAVDARESWMDAVAHGSQERADRVRVTLVELGSALDAVNKYQLGTVHVAARSGYTDCAMSNL